MSEQQRAEYPLVWKCPLCEKVLKGQRARLAHNRDVHQFKRGESNKGRKGKSYRKPSGRGPGGILL
jgi:uncharacterized C2H2 Zn-finger protein